MIQCELYTRAPVVEAEVYWLRCPNPSIHRFEMKTPNHGVGNIERYILVNVCDSCVSTMTGWH